jgi:hypothetical protein
MRRSRGILLVCPAGMRQGRSGDIEADLQLIPVSQAELVRILQAEHPAPQLQPNYKVQGPLERTKDATMESHAKFIYHPSRANLMFRPPGRAVRGLRVLHGSGCRGE